MASTTLSMRFVAPDADTRERPSYDWQSYLPADDAWMEGVFLPDRRGANGIRSSHYTPSFDRNALIQVGIPSVYADHLIASPLAWFAAANTANLAHKARQAAWDSYRSYGAQNTEGEPSSQPRLGLRLSTTGMSGGGARSGAAARNGVVTARLSLCFGPGTASAGRPGNLPRRLAPVRLELFAVAKQFGYALYGPEGGNLRWAFDAQPHSGARFEAYGRNMFFFGFDWLVLGAARVVMDRVADLYVIWDFCPIPASVKSRVDAKQKMNYKVDSQGMVLELQPENTGAVIGFHAVLEFLHRESGEVRTVKLTNGSPGQFKDVKPNGWAAMSMDGGGVIRHEHAELSYGSPVLPTRASAGLPVYGAVRVRYILIGYYYFTGVCRVLNDALGRLGVSNDDGIPMSVDSLWVMEGPSSGNYTPGMSEGVIPPLEFELPVALAAGIEFDAVFDLINRVVLRFVVKVTNHHDFVLGVVVKAYRLTAWVRIMPGETKYLSGSCFVTADLSLGVASDGELFGASFSVLLTVPTQPETILPTGLPERELSDRVWIKIYNDKGEYDFNYSSDPIKLAGVSRVTPITAPLRPILNASDLFFETPLEFSTIGPRSVWFFQVLSNGHEGCWCSGEWFEFDPNQSAEGAHIGGQYFLPGGLYGSLSTPRSYYGRWVYDAGPVFVPFSVSMYQNVLSSLGIDDSVVIDGRDVARIAGSTQHPLYGYWWADRFYTKSGALVTESMISTVVQRLIDDALKINGVLVCGDFVHRRFFRNLKAMPEMRFGMAFSEIQRGGIFDPNRAPELIEVSGLDIESASTKFLLRGQP